MPKSQQGYQPYDLRSMTLTLRGHIFEAALTFHLQHIATGAKMSRSGAAVPSQAKNECLFIKRSYSSSPGICKNV